MGFSTIKSLCIVWGVMLAFITIMDWNTLEKNPIDEEILTPFITREITLVATDNQYDSELSMQERKVEPQYQVEIGFDGIKFLMYFFGPILIIYSVGQLLGKAGKIKSR